MVDEDFAWRLTQGLVRIDSSDPGAYEGEIEQHIKGLVEAKVKRSRGTDAAPKVNKKRLQRVAMCFAADHPEVEAISFDVLEVIVGSEATLTFNAAKAAFTWER